MDIKNKKMPITSYGAWDHQRSLGEGAFGEVHHFIHRYTRQEIATKRLKINNHLKSDEIEILKKRWLQESQWMLSLDTNCIVRAVDTNDSDFLKYLQSKNALHMPPITMEYCNGGDLRQELNELKNFNGLNEFEVRNVLRTLRLAVEYLHTKINVEHRDIKPENIVIQYNGNEKLYKLTDFGYARDIPDSTIAQSVVGTRDYVAPEVIDPGCYTNTVDYWSVGVMAFEIICGVRPFIPHQTFIKILTNIKLKPDKCIAITQMIDEPITDRYQFEEKIFPENHLSPIFADKIQKWLCLSLDKNYQTRGLDKCKQLKFYTDLDMTLNTKILTVFSLKSFKKFYYDIETFKELGDLFQKISTDTGINKEHIFLVLPTCHPKSLADMKKPIDFYVSEWRDTGNSDNPPVMLYIADSRQCDFNGNHDPPSKIAFTCMPKDPEKCSDYPSWILEKFEKHIYFELNKEQHNVECYLNGLYEYIITVENEAFRLKPSIDKIYEDTLILSGRIQQFHITVTEFVKTQTEEIRQKWLNKSQEFFNNYITFKEKAVNHIKNRFESVLRHCKELAKNDIYKTMAKKDIFKLNEFGQLISQKPSNVARMLNCQRAFEHFYTEYPKFIGNSALKEIRHSINKQVGIYIQIEKCIKESERCIAELNKKLSTETEFLMCSNNDLTLSMQSLRIGGVAAEIPAVSLSNGYSLCNGDVVFDPDTADVLKESNKLLMLINSTMDIDEDTSMYVDIPTTIDNI